MIVHTLTNYAPGVPLTTWGKNAVKNVTYQNKMSFSIWILLLLFQLQT